MRRIKMILLALVATIAMGAVGASAASAGYFTGTISGSNWLGEITQCDFQINTAKTPVDVPPPAAQTLLGNTFAGIDGPSNNPCDPETVELSNVNATFAAHGAHDDMILASGFTVSASGCTFTAGSSYTLHGGTVPSGSWTGSGTAGGSPFFCGTATINLSNVTYHSW